MIRPPAGMVTTDDALVRFTTGPARALVFGYHRGYRPCGRPIIITEGWSHPPGLDRVFVRRLGWGLWRQP